MLIRIKPLFLLFVSIVFFTASVYSQAPAIAWQRCFGGNNGDYALKVIPTSDGGYITVGYTEGSDNGDVTGYHGNIAVNDGWVVKMDRTGNLQWQRCLGGDYMDRGEDILQLPDGGYAVLLSSATDNCMYTGNHGGLDYRLIKLDAKGDIEWQKTYGGSKNEYASRMELTKDGGYIIAGETESDNGDVTINFGDRDFWVIKLNAEGNLQWQKSYGGSGDDEALAVSVAHNGGFIVGGFTNSNDNDVSGNHGKQDGWVIKIDDNGNVQWQKCIGGSSQFEYLKSVQATADGGCVISGSTSSNDGNISGKHNPLYESTDVMVVKLNSTGIIEWQKCYGGSNNDYSACIQVTKDGGYVLCGFTESSDGDITCNAGGLDDMWIVKVNSIGALQWQKSIGGNSFDEALYIQTLQDGSYILCGVTCSTNVNESDYHKPTNQGTCGDYWIIKLAAAAPATVTISMPAAVCNGATNTLTASVFNCSINPVYQWKRNGADVGTNSSQYSASDFKDNDVVTCQVNTKGTCDPTASGATGTKIIKLNNAVIHPSVAITADNTTVCDCTPLSFKATVTNGGTAPVYKWNVNGVYTGVSGVSYTRYIPQAGDAITCTYMDSAACIDHGYITSEAIVLQNTSSSPQVTISSSVNNVCTGTAITFTAQATNAGVHPIYKWTVNGTDAGTNNSSFTDSNLKNGDRVNCSVTTDPSAKCAVNATSVSNNIIVTISPAVKPTVSIKAASTTICTGAAAKFTASATNAGANPEYQWEVNGTAVGINSNSFITTSLTNGDKISCLLKVDPSFTCTTVSTAISNEVAVTVTEQQNTTVTITSSEKEVCAGKHIVFTATAQYAGVSPFYQWQINNSNVGSNSKVFETNQLSKGDLVVCKVTASNNTCSQEPVQSAPLSIIIRDTPVISIAPADTFIRTSSQLQLIATVTGTGNTFQWKPADQLDNPLSLTPLTKPLNKDVIYTLQVKGSNDCIAVKTATVKVFSTLAMPGAFTPNNDGYNDVFRIPPHVSLTLSEFAVYNRWGKKVFTTTDINRGWTGMINSLPADAGVYIYIINGKNEKGPVNAKGSFVLIR